MLAFSQVALTLFRSPIVGNSAAYKRLGLPKSVNNQSNPLQTFPHSSSAQPELGNSLLPFSFPLSLGCVKLTVNTKKHFIPQYWSKRSENLYPQKDLFTNCDSRHNRLKLEIVWMLIRRAGINKPLVYLYHGPILSSEKLLRVEWCAVWKIAF